MRGTRGRCGVGLCDSWFGLRLLVFELVAGQEGDNRGGAAGGLDRARIVVFISVVVLLGVRRLEALPRALDAEADVVNETGNRHIEGLYREALPLNRGRKRLDGATNR